MDTINDNIIYGIDYGAVYNANAIISPNDYRTITIERPQDYFLNIHTVDIVDRNTGRNISEVGAISIEYDTYNGKIQVLVDAEKLADILGVTIDNSSIGENLDGFVRGL